MNEHIHKYPLPFTYLTLSIAVSGVIGNSIILLAITRSKSLQNRCHFLIGSLAFCDLISSIYYVTLRVFILLYWYDMSNARCFLLSLYGLFTMNCQTGLTVSLAIDRYLAIRYPVSYRKWNPRVYVSLLVLPILIFSLTMVLWGYRVSNREVTVMVCFPPNAYMNPARNFWIYSNFVIVFLVIFTYTKSHMVMLRMKKSAVNSSFVLSMVRVMESMRVVMLVYCLTWALTVIMLNLIQNVFGRNEVGRFIELLLGLPVVVMSAVNLPIYLWRATDMRRAVVRLVTGNGNTETAATVLTSVHSRGSIPRNVEGIADIRA